MTPIGLNIIAGAAGPSAAKQCSNTQTLLSFGGGKNANSTGEITQ